ncbi:MAG: S8 family peptidase [Candidatus Woesearchaeota archaeon]
MVKNEALERILNYISNDYKNEDPDIEPSYKIKRGFDNLGLKIFYDKKITDYYVLDIDPNKDNSKSIIKTSFIEKLKYKNSGIVGKDKLIKKLNLKYIKPKENELENLVTSEKVSKIELRTNDIKSKLSSLNYKLDNISYEKNEQPPKKNNSYQNKKNEYLERKQDLINDYLKNNPSRRLIISLKEIETNDLKDYISEISHKINKQFTDTQIYSLNSIPLIALNGNAKDVERIAKHLNNTRSRLNNLKLFDKNLVKYTEFDNLYFLPEIGNSYKLIDIRKNDTLWNLKNIGADIAQQYAKGEGINVGIIDTGVDYNHNELKDNFNINKLGYNFINENNDPFDDHGHGTHVAGTVSGNSIGVAPNSNLFAIKVLDENGMGTSYTVMQGVDWAINNNLDIINLSLGSSYYLNSEQELYNKAFNSGILTVAAAGNSYDDSYSYPASYNNVISVAAVDKNNNHAEFSSHNDMVDISAPGVNVYSSIPNNQYAEYSGTSMASPHIAGSSSLIKSFEFLYPEEIEELLVDSSKYLGDSNYFGSGLVRVDDAIHLIEQIFKKKKKVV